MRVSYWLAHARVCVYVSLSSHHFTFPSSQNLPSKFTTSDSSFKFGAKAVVEEAPVPAPVEVKAAPLPLPVPGPLSAPPGLSAAPAAPVYAADIEKEQLAKADAAAAAQVRVRVCVSKHACVCRCDWFMPCLRV